MVPGKGEKIVRETHVAADQPDKPKGREQAVAPAALLQAEIGRLKAELIDAEGKIAELEARADIDPLLCIFNRRGFARELARSLAYVKRYGTAAALMFIDLDLFKGINDQHGHAAGDAVLKAVATGLSAHVRASDVVARFGGDEFAVLMWNLGEAQATAKARELENIIGQIGVPHGAARLSVGASAGVVPLTADANAGEIIDAADKAMYARKKERRS
jgi:diguanylate cyclase (GGDEF)-like protein